MRLDQLGEVARGKSRHRPRNDPRLFGGPYPFIQTADIMAADPYIMTYSQTLSEFGLAQSRLWPADTLCITIAGANTARTAILKFRACFPDSVIGFRPDPRKANIYFIKYALDLMRERFLSVTRGATQDNLSLDKLLAFPISTPPPEIQRRIGGILAAYDDLIECNRRRVGILNEIARRIFEEFVTSRIGTLPIPGDRLQERNIPKGWRFDRLTDLATIIMGQSPPSETYNSVGRGIPFHQGVTDFDGFFHKNRLFVDEADRLRIAEAGDVLFSVRAPVARISLALNRMVLGRGLAAIRPTPAIRNFVHTHLRGTFPQIDMFGNGAIYKAATKNDVHNIPIVWPGDQRVRELEHHLEPIWSAIRVFYLSNIDLHAARDLVVAKMICGQVDSSQRPGTMADDPSDQVAAE
jgi:type I restriction enzyme S subunit